MPSPGRDKCGLATEAGPLRAQEARLTSGPRARVPITHSRRQYLPWKWTHLGNRGVHANRGPVLSISAVRSENLDLHSTAMVSAAGASRQGGRRLQTGNPPHQAYVTPSPHLLPVLPPSPSGGLPSSSLGRWLLPPPPSRVSAERVWASCCAIWRGVKGRGLGFGLAKPRSRLSRFLPVSRLSRSLGGPAAGWLSRFPLLCKS